MLDNARWVTDPPTAEAHVSAEQALGREQGHLGIVRDGTHPAVGRLVLADTFGAKLVPNLRKREKLDWGTQSVADGPAEKAAEDARLR
jgi:hypothetical protein